MNVFLYSVLGKHTGRDFSWLLMSCYELTVLLVAGPAMVPVGETGLAVIAVVHMDHLHRREPCVCTKASSCEPWWENSSSRMNQPKVEGNLTLSFYLYLSLSSFLSVCFLFLLMFFLSVFIFFLSFLFVLSVSLYVFLSLFIFSFLSFLPSFLSSFLHFFLSLSLSLSL